MLLECFENKYLILKLYRKAHHDTVRCFHLGGSKQTYSEDKNTDNIGYLSLSFRVIVADIVNE